MRSSLAQSDSTQSETLPGNLSGWKGKLALCSSLNEYLWEHCITFHMPQTLLKKTKWKKNEELKGSHIITHFALKQINTSYLQNMFLFIASICLCVSVYTLKKKFKIFFIAYSWTSLIASTLKYTFRLSSMNHTGWFNSIPTFNHILGLITPWKHLLNNASPSYECLLTMWPMKELNLAQMTFPFPLNVVVVLQYKWFSRDLIHLAIDSHPFSLESFERTFLISENKGGWILQLVKNNADQNNCHFSLMIIYCIPIWLLLHYQWPHCL